MIIRQKEPANLETPLREVDRYLTPAQLFYVRSHFASPKLSSEAYRLHIGGDVYHPFTLTLDELQAMHSITVIATIECAGNSRVFLVPPTQGAQWGVGAVGTAEWKGVPLRSLLERAGLQEGVLEIILEGADRGRPKEEPIPAGEISYVRSLPLAKALSDEVLIAYNMNGQDLLKDHGYPVRAIVPGHYGMASVKWLTSIHAVSEPFRGYWQTSDYAYWDTLEGLPVRRGLGEMAVKSVIIKPGTREVIQAGETYTISGAAWAGESIVDALQVSSDGGETWDEANWIDSVHRFAWRRWEFNWRVPSRGGSYILMSRAKDSKGVTQPKTHDERFGSYVVNHMLPIEVVVSD